MENFSTLKFISSTYLPKFAARLKHCDVTLVRGRRTYVVHTRTSTYRTCEYQIQRHN